MFGFGKKKKRPPLGNQGGGDSRMIVGTLALGMAHIIRARGKGMEDIEQIIGPMWDLVRQNTGSDEKAQEVIKFNLDNAFKMPPDAIPDVVAKLSENMSMTAKHEVAITLLWYARFTGDESERLPEEKGGHVPNEIKDMVCQLYMNGMGIPERDREMLKAQARQRFDSASGDGGQQKPPASPPPKQAPPPPRSTASESKTTIDSSQAGTFYEAPYPDADPYISVGATIEPDTIIGKIEAMQAYNEVRAETRGTVARVLVKNGQRVERGQPLFELQAAKPTPTSRPTGGESVLPDDPKLRRTLLQIVVANIALISKLNSTNRAHEVGDMSARMHGIAETVRDISRQHGRTISMDQAFETMEAIKQYFIAYLDAIESITSNLLDPSAMLENIGKLDLEFESPFDVAGQINKRLPPGLPKIDVDDAKAIEAGVAQADKEAAK